jgi:hypothetical protein
VSWEDNETRKDPKAIYLILVNSRKRTKVKQSQGKIGSTSSSSAAGACKAALSDWDEKAE